MKDHYDFSNAEQGRFYTKTEDMIIPHYLSPSIESRLRGLAKRKGRSPEDLLVAILDKESALFEKID